MPPRLPPEFESLAAGRPGVCCPDCDGALMCRFEPSDESLVVSELQVHSLSCACGTSPCISVQPRIQELAAFFLSVFTVSKEELTPPAIGRMLSDDDTSFFGAEGMEIESDDNEGRRTPPHQLSPPSSLTPVAKSPARPVVVLESREFPRRHKGNASQVCVEASGQCNDAALSARTTPNSCTDSEYKTSPALPGSSFSTSVHLSTSVTSMLVEQESSHLKGLDATLLMTMTDNQDEYESHTHLILKDRACCLRLLQRIKLDALVQLVLDVQGGLRSGHSPVETSSFSLPQEGLEETKPSPAYGSLQSDFDYGELVDNCCGGTYRMKGPDGQLCAIFKPSDEEPYAPENPKGYFGSMFEESAMKPGIRVGSGAARECSAYLLDHGGFASVPVTAMLYITHTVIVPEDKAEVQIKVGSLQRFHQHKCTAEDMGTCRFRMSDVHSIGVFDVRTFNMDRNSDNLLVASLLAGEARHGDESMLRLVPIDHGYILPSCKHLEDANLCWLYWPQARKPYEEETLRYIEGLDAEADESLLRMTLGLPEDCLLTLFIGTTLVQKGAAAGLTLHATGLLMLRDNPLEQSAIENVLAESLESCGLTGSIDSEWRSPKLRAELSERIENLVQETVGQRRVSANFMSMYKTLSASRGGSSLGLDRLIIAEIA